MNMESTGAGSAGNTEREDFAKVDARLDEIKSMNIGDMSDDDAEQVLAERKALRTQKTEMVGSAQEEATAEGQTREVYDEAHEMNRGIDEAEQKKAEAEKAAAEATAQAEQAKQIEERRQAELAQADALLAEIKGGNTGANQEVTAEIPVVEVAGGVVMEKTLEQGEKSAEDIYGMTVEDLAKLIQSDGNISKDEMLATNDRYGVDASNKFKRAEVMLFDRVLSGEATEEEMSIAVAHATQRAKDGDPTHSANIPKAWYTNERIADAIDNSDPRNKGVVARMKRNYPGEKLSDEYRKINEDGSVSTYNR